MLQQVSYLHIKTYLTMQEIGVSAEEIERPSESNKPGKAFYTIIYIPSWKLINYSFWPHIGGDPNLSSKQTRSSEFHGDDLPAAKCRKVEEDTFHLEATETSILEWIRGRDEVCFMILKLQFSWTHFLKYNFIFQASFSDIVEHFNGSDRESVLTMLNTLEGGFLIFKKNGMYRVL